MNKKLSESDICAKYITPHLVSAGWEPRRFGARSVSPRAALSCAAIDYFAAATQIGLTATPKETEYVSNIQYFGPPVYTYSLKQGIRISPYRQTILNRAKKSM